MAHTLYTSCAEVLSLSQSKKEDLSFLLDPETGFAPKIRQICQETLAEAEASGNPLSAEEVNALRLESDTWGLLQAIMPLRKTQSPRYPRANELLARNPYTPTSTLAEAIMHSSRLLTELVVVREWLHDTAPEPPALDATTGYWKFTKNQVMQNLRLNRPNSLSGMDPDAVSRGDGTMLAPDDVVYEKALVSSLYGYIRAGRLDDAIELCNKADQPWRAASIRGSVLFQWRAVANEPQDADAMDESEDSQTWQGNRRRRLWKTACTRAALNSNLSDTERALYAALAPTPQTATQLKNACHTWEDHLWAQISVVCEEKESEELSKLTDSFWESGGLGTSRDNAGLDSLGDGEDDEWQKEVVESLESLASVTIQEGSPVGGLYHTSQLHIILDRTESLLEQFVEGLKAEAYVNMPEYPTLTRFFAHLCLYLQMIDVSPPPLATQVILEAYLQVLEAAGQRELIAMYAGALGDNAVERYAMFLTSLELSADIAERRLALTRARDHGLDMERVAVATAERTIEHAFSVLPAPRGTLPVVSAPQPPPSDKELLLVRSIEWTTFMDSTYDTALEQSVVILRYLLGCGRLEVAKALLGVLPSELASIREPEERSVEYMHYRQFFMVWESLNRVVETKALEASQMTKDTRAAWLDDYKTLIQQAHDKVIRLLTTDWLITDADRVGDDRRKSDLLRIREILIPELILRLHTILLESRWRIPENLKHTLDLANIVADSRYRLYDDFANVPQRKLSDYLLAVRQAILGGLEGGGSDPFRIVTL